MVKERIAVILSDFRIISLHSEDNTSITKRTGITLATKSSKKGVLNLSKAVPIAGGLIGASMDVWATNLMGKLAIRTFLFDE
ncbi:hypothetical protein MASR1M74_14310 [Lentimicrobium sp.]